MSAYAFGNYGHYRGETLAEIIDSRRNQIESQIKEVGMQICEHMNYNEYSAWIDSLPNTDGATLLRTMQEKLDALETEECTCTDPERTCPACRHAAYHQWFLKGE